MDANFISDALNLSDAFDAFGELKKGKLIALRIEHYLLANEYGHK
jgi:hypothetical protein